MIQRAKLQWLAFNLFKNNVAIAFGGKKKFESHFNTPNSRKMLYEGLLYKNHIPGGEKNDKIVKHYTSFITNFDLSSLFVDVSVLKRQYEDNMA